MTEVSGESEVSVNTPVAGGGVRVLVDGHGGDEAPDMVIQALELLASGRSVAEGRLQLGIVGLPEKIAPMLQARGLSERVELVECSDVIDMCDSPSVALRRKKNSSIHIGARLVRDGKWDALVSAGNTGALMAISKLVLKTLPGIDRPAIASLLPSDEGTCTLLLDAGANTDCTSDHLVQFAIMGSCYMQAAEGLESPRVGLLNIGSEDIKGTDVIKLTSSQLSGMPLNFIGNVEGTELFSKDVDVIVCDGFVGNVALKTIEGTARFLASNMRDELTSGLLARTGAALASRALKRFKDKVNPGRYNGAPLLGLNGIVVKSHGSADASAFANAVGVACREVGEQLIERITTSVQESLEA